MKFGKVQIGDALGAVLGHSVPCGDQLLKKSQVLDRADIALLTENGVVEVYAARLEASDVTEDKAADAFARALGGDGVRIGIAATGRCNLFASEAGVVQIDALTINQLNQLDESVTIASLSPFERVEKGQLVATVKIIPYAVPENTITVGLAMLASKQPVQVSGFKPKRVGLIITKLAHSKDSLLEKTQSAMAERVESMGSEIGRVSVVDHNANAVSLALNATSPHHDLTLVFGASAIVDRGDVVPKAIGQVGGEILHFGMPVDPGNLLLLARINEMPVLGVPSCARSGALNGFDWVLQRILAGVEVTGKDLMGMGVGGLLKEIPTRPRPREQT